jgi:hypothetical protein
MFAIQLYPCNYWFGLCILRYFYCIYVPCTWSPYPTATLPPAVLLRESSRLDGKIVKRTLANLSDWPRFSNR